MKFGPQRRKQAPVGTDKRHARDEQLPAIPGSPGPAAGAAVEIAGSAPAGFVLPALGGARGEFNRTYPPSYETVRGLPVVGACSPQNDTVKLLRLHDAGRLKLDELITARYTLDQVNRDNRDLNDGKNIRGVIV